MSPSRYVKNRQQKGTIARAKNGKYYVVKFKDEGCVYDIYLSSLRARIFLNIIRQGGDVIERDEEGRVIIDWRRALILVRRLYINHEDGIGGEPTILNEEVLEEMLPATF